MNNSLSGICAHLVSLHISDGSGVDFVSLILLKCAHVSAIAIWCALYGCVCVSAIAIWCTLYGCVCVCVSAIAIWCTPYECVCVCISNCNLVYSSS